VYGTSHTKTRPTGRIGDDGRRTVRNRPGRNTDRRAAINEQAWTVAR